MVRYIALFLFLCTVAARADVTYNGYSLVYGTGVTIEYNGETITGGAGLVDLYNVQGLGTETTLPVLCVDVENYLQSSGTFLLENASSDPNLAGQSPFQLTALGTKISDITALVYAWASGDVTQVLSNTSLDDIASAVQTDIWASEYATSTITSNGQITGWTGITITPSDPTVMPAALNLLNNISSLPAVPSNVVLNVLTPPAGGNQTMALTITQVAEPNSIAVLLTGLLLLMTARVTNGRKSLRNHN